MTVENNNILDTSVTWEDLQQKCFELFGPAARFGPNKRVQNIAEGKVGHPPPGD